MNEQRKTYADLKDELLITRDQIAKRVKEMGAEITRDFEGKNLTVICILKGAVVFFVDLVREIDLPMTMDFMAISSYGSATKSSGVVRILKDLDKPINGRDVLIIEDIVDSGMTLSFLKENLGSAAARPRCISPRCWISRSAAACRCMWIISASRFRMSSSSVTALTMPKSIGTCRTSACCVRKSTNKIFFAAAQAAPTGGSH